MKKSLLATLTVLLMLPLGAETPLPSAADWLAFLPAADRVKLLSGTELTAIGSKPAQLPYGATLERTEKVIREMSEIALKEPGVESAIAFPGLSISGFINSSSAGIVFVSLKPFEERRSADLSGFAISRKLQGKYFGLRDAFIAIFPPPPVMGLGTIGGFKLQVLDRTSAGPQRLEAAAGALVDAAAAQPGLTGLFSGFRSDEPKFFVDIDREKVKAQGVDLAEVNAALQIYLGSAYVNDWTAFGRNWPVLVQADRDYRMRREDIGRLEVRNAAGEMVPLSTLVTVTDSVAVPPLPSLTCTVNTSSCDSPAASACTAGLPLLSWYCH